MKFIRTSKILFAPNINKGKLDEVSVFLDWCNDALNFYLVQFIDFYQLDKLLFVNVKHKNRKLFANESKLNQLNNIFYALCFDEVKEEYYFQRKLKFYPDEILSKNLTSCESAENILSVRTLKSVKTQAFAIIKSWVKQILQSFQFGFLNYEQGKYKKSHRKNLIKNCHDKYRVVKNLKQGKVRLEIDKFEFNSINCQLLARGVDNDFQLSDESEFDLIFKLHSMYDRKHKVCHNNSLSIPLKSHQHYQELKNGIVANVPCKMDKKINSILVSKTGIEVRFQIEPLAKEAKFKPHKVGIDQGQRKLFTAMKIVNGYECSLKETDLLNELKTTYNAVCDKVARKQKGSKGFKHAQEHRKNLINQAVNILAQIFNFEDDVAEVFLEKLRRLGEGKKKSRKLQAFNYADFRHKLERKCQETNVEFTETSNAYRSQRCSLCGFVHKKNRLNGGEEFKCIQCGYTADADDNSAKNQVSNLPPLYYNRTKYPNHTTGFYWLCD